ncbi:MAG: Hsp20/alpha crystallin family protein [Deltaproteobacteria bacterium]|nr:Hsp20/alpha crystallin family protein [Deltaproteobacteria bacterium]
MSSLIRWEPFHEIEEVTDRLGRVLDRTLRRAFGRESLIPADWAPAVDISETDKEYVIKAELPEVAKDDVRVAIQDDMLVIRGERRAEKEEKGRRYHRIERSYGTFARSFGIPEDADPAKITAEFRDGILDVHLPKTTEVKKRTIEVKVS